MIYSKKKMWAGEKEKKYKFYSGLGSHSEELTNKYIIELRNFLQSFSKTKRCEFRMRRFCHWIKN